MIAGIAIAYSGLPVELIARHGLRGRVHDRGGEPEVQFLLHAAERVLPVWLDGRLQIVQWGNRRGQGRGLPCTAWTRLETVAAGGWGDREVVRAVIPATMGLDGGVWYRVRELLVRDNSGAPAVYVLVEPASHYYQIMTRSAWMPVLVGERI
jgi:hypothetical protein